MKIFNTFFLLSSSLATVSIGACTPPPESAFSSESLKKLDTTFLLETHCTYFPGAGKIIDTSLKYKTNSIPQCTSALIINSTDKVKENTIKITKNSSHYLQVSPSESGTFNSKIAIVQRLLPITHR
jgi:hypothetical protein